MCKEYLFYDFLEHIFCLKYKLNEYDIKDDKIIMSISFRDFFKYYHIVVKKLLLDHVEVQSLNRENLLVLILKYDLYKVKYILNDYYIFSNQIVYHPYDINKLTIDELNAFYGNEAKKVVLKKQLVKIK